MIIDTNAFDFQIFRSLAVIDWSFINFGFIGLNEPSQLSNRLLEHLGRVASRRLYFFVVPDVQTYH